MESFTLLFQIFQFITFLGFILFLGIRISDIRVAYFSFRKYLLYLLLWYRNRKIINKFTFRILLGSWLVYTKGFRKQRIGVCCLTMVCSVCFINFIYLMLFLFNYYLWFIVFLCNVIVDFRFWITFLCVYVNFTIYLVM